MSHRLAGAFVLVFLLAAAMPASAGVVSVVGDAVVFDAGSDEVNTVVVNGDGAVFDQSTGTFVSGITVNDTTASFSATAPCRILTGGAVCNAPGITRVIVRTGNRDDNVSMIFNGGLLLRMTVDGGLGDDTITGGPGADTLNGDAGNDHIDGGDGDDVINGGTGNDTINGGSNADHLFGNAGTDIINGDSGADEIDGGIGDDIIDGGQGTDTIRGDAGADRIAGRDGFIDNINCGIGRDETNVDGNDVLKRCE